MLITATGAALFAAYFATLYAAHHVGDYWVQSDHQARHKGLPGREGRAACARHVGTYVLTQEVLLVVLWVVIGVPVSGPWNMLVAMAVSGGTHYLADRRKPLEAIARWLDPMSGKHGFYRLGMPRLGKDDNPSLGTGAWALDQSWHIMFSVFVPALILAA